MARLNLGSVAAMVLSAARQPVRKVCGLGISFTGMRGSSIMIPVVLEQSFQTSVFGSGYWRRRPETKAVLPALFSVTCLPTLGAWAASDWPAEVIHHLGSPNGGSCLVPASPAVPAAAENDNHDDQNDEKCGVVHLSSSRMRDGQLVPESHRQGCSDLGP